MATRLECRICGEYLGTVTQGSLHKRMVNLCPVCWGPIHLNLESRRTLDTPFKGNDPETKRIFDTLFGGL